MPRAATSIRWWVYAPATPKLEALMADPEAVLAGPGILARELTGRKRFFRVDAQGAEPALYVKVFALPPGAKRLRYFLLRSKARREHAIAAQIERLGFEVEPLGAEPHQLFLFRLCSRSLRGSRLGRPDSTDPNTDRPAPRALHAAARGDPSRNHNGVGLPRQVPVHRPP